MTNPHEQHLVVVGLGNPGKAYEFTRHNIGFLVAEAVAKMKGWGFKEEKRFLARFAKGKIGDKTLHLLMPVTYMNDSGRAVKAYLDYYQLSPHQIVVVTDDVALPFGHIRVRSSGGAGGHNGLKSIQAYLGTDSYMRLRMGINEKPVLMALADYVLSSFSSEEMAALPPFIDKGAAIAMRLLTEEITQVMNSVNTRLESKPVDLNQRSGEEI